MSSSARKPVSRKKLLLSADLGDQVFRLGPYLFRGIHWIAREALKRRGYKLDLRRRGDTKLGLWRKKLKKIASPNRRLVVLPGFGDSPLSWLPLLATLSPVLSRRYDEIVLVDFPGFHGFLEKERGFASLDEMQSFAFDTLDTLRPNAILGHSLGGWLAATYAALCSVRERPVNGKNRYSGPEKLVVVCPSGLIRPHEKEEWKACFEMALGGEYVDFMKRMFKRMPTWYRFAGSALSSFFDKPEVRSFIESVGDQHFLNDRLNGVAAKPFVIWGDDDRINPYGWFELWIEQLGKGRTEGIILPGIGHMPHVESPARLIAVLAQVFTVQYRFPRHSILRKLTAHLWKAV